MCLAAAVEELAEAVRLAALEAAEKEREKKSQVEEAAEKGASEDEIEDETEAGDELDAIDVAVDAETTPVDEVVETTSVEVSGIHLSTPQHTHAHLVIKYHF